MLEISKFQILISERAMRKIRKSRAAHKALLIVSDFFLYIHGQGLNG